MLPVLFQEIIDIKRTSQKKSDFNSVKVLSVCTDLTFYLFAGVGRWKWKRRATAAGWIPRSCHGDGDVP